MELGKQNCRVVVIDNLHRLNSEELRRQIIALEQREDIWLILISRSPVPAWLMSQHIKDVFIVINEDDLRLNAEEIGSYLDACGVAHTEKEVQYLQGTAEGNAYVVHHVALKLKERAVPQPGTL